MFIKNNEDLYVLLDQLLREPTQFWNEFYKDKEKKIPFFCDVPDEHLVKYVEQGTIQPKRVLDLGCGNGRNAIYFAKLGCTVTAVDLSKEAIVWAQEQARNEHVVIEFICENIFDLQLNGQTFDFIYDSGLFHHLAPHRRLSYIQFIEHHLESGGHFAISVFKENGKYGGSALPDLDFYRDRSLHGGIGYTKEKLQQVFNRFEEVEIRPMQYDNLPPETFGLEDFVVCLFKK